MAKSPPDGYTLLIIDTVQFVMSMHLYRDVATDPVRDFAPVAGREMNSLGKVGDG